MSSETGPGHIVIGAACGSALWTFEAIRALAQLAPGRDVIVADRTHPLPTDGGGARIILCQYPSQDVIGAIASGSLRPLLLIEDPAEIAGYMMRQAGRSPLEAVRALTASLVANLALAAAPSTRLIEHRAGASARAYVRGIAEALDLTASEAELDRVMAGLARGLPADAGLDAAIASRFPAHFCGPDAGASDPETGAIAKRVAGPLLALARGDSTSPIVWPAEVFLSGDRPNEPAPRITSVAGPARVILYGPYFHLPPAEYVVEAVMSFRGHIDDIPFVLEIRSSECLASARINHRPAGGYRGQFRFSHHNPVDALEIHFRSERGAIDGELSLHELRFFPQTPYFSALA